MDLNRVQIIGRLTQDPELRQTPSGQSVVSFSIATNYTYKDKGGQEQKMVEYHNIVAWRGLAETISKYLRKGSRVFLEGRLQTRSWDDPSGTKKYKTEIIADNMIMLDSKGGSQGEFMNDAPASNNAPAPFSMNDDDEISIEEVPF